MIMRIRCKGFDVTLEYTKGYSRLVTHSVDNDVRGLGRYHHTQYKGFDVGSYSFPELNAHSICIGGTDIHRDNECPMYKEPEDKYKVRLQALIKLAEKFGYKTEKKTHLPDWLIQRR